MNPPLPPPNSFLIDFKGILKNTFTDIWRHRLESSATIILMAIIIFIFNIIISIQNAGESIIRTLNNKVDIIVYIADDIDFSEIDNLIEELRAFPEVKEVKYTDKESALKEILKAFPEQQNPFEKYGLENRLPANLQIVTDSPKAHPKIISFLYEGKYSYLLKNVENNRENQMIAQKLISITDAIQKILFGIITAFFIGGFLVIMNGIYLAIHSRRIEIYIMKLVGASYTYIKAPFILQGVLYGAIAALLSILLLFIFLSSINISEFGIKIPFNNISTLIIVESIAGMILGTIASVVATERYIRINQI